MATPVRLIGVWKPKEPRTGASSGRPKRRRRARPASGSTCGGSGMPIGTSRTRASGTSSAICSAAQRLCTRTPRWASSRPRWAGRAKTGASPQAFQILATAAARPTQP